MISKGSRRFDSAQQEAYLSLWRTYDRLRQIEDELFARHDLTPQQYNLLRLLQAGHPERRQTLDLASRLISRAPDITRMLDRLQERGFIDRERPAGDRRTVCIGITRIGLHLLESLAQEVRDCHQRQLGHMDPDELAQLSTLLRKARTPHESPESPWR